MDDARSSCAPPNGATQPRRHEHAPGRGRRRRHRSQSPLTHGAEADERHRWALAEAGLYSRGDDALAQSGETEKFHWRKKEALQHRAGISPEEAAAREAARREETAQEVERLAARRMQRERAKREREETQSQAARLAESAAMAAWVAKEDDFQLEQTRRRAVIRVRENRAKPIDLLVINQLWVNPLQGRRQPSSDTDGSDSDDDGAGLEIDLEEPYAVLDGLLRDELTELHGEIRTFVELEKDDHGAVFWRNMLIVCDDALKRHHADPTGTARIDPSIAAETDAMLASRSYEDLGSLQASIRAKLRSGEPLDVEYWEQLLRRIVVWRSKAKLREMHAAVLTNRIAFLQRRQRREARRQQRAVAEQMEGGPKEAARGERDARPPCGPTPWDAAEMEPEPRTETQLLFEERQLPRMTLDDRRAGLVAARRCVLQRRFVPRSSHSAHHRSEDTAVASTDGESFADEMFRREAERPLDVEEEVFTEDVRLEQAPIYQWGDKYRARKPRFFNRVHTGYEWNKYNQTHYDTENPPPKVVQGYKFNIFYPDLIDMSKVPTYKILRNDDSDPAHRDTVLLRFSAGPPYEDIAFRIVDKEWEYSHRRGFRCSFDRGILQLYFNFKRLRYRQ
ncbi:hypothetical protein MSPP1_001192 [Malassezia sp. CBS 17886]|nr:hypothetical protein MSPP1_001192 [Malassezia sp. CBS 17886]